MLTLTGISKTYPGGVQALQDIQMDVPSGMFGLLGPNGAGKSSLMRTIATLQPDCGSITFNGIDVLKDKTALRPRLFAAGVRRLPTHLGPNDAQTPRDSEGYSRQSK